MTLNRALCSAALILLLFGCAAEKPAPAPAAPAPAAAAPSARDAEKLVTNLYRDHDGNRSPFFQTDSRAPLDLYFEPSLAELIWKDVVDAKGEVGALDFDPLYDGQDVDPKNLIIHPAQPDGATLRVPVSYDNYGQKRKLTYVLASAGGAWKISNIRYDDGRTLRDVYRPVAEGNV